MHEHFQGERGASGSKGATGQRGADGIPGSQGSSGQIGPKGEPVRSDYHTVLKLYYFSIHDI